METKEYYRQRWLQKLRKDPTGYKSRNWLNRLLFNLTGRPQYTSRFEVAERLLRGGERILDIGCENGGFLGRLKEKNLYQEYFGADIVPEALLMVKARGMQAIEVDLNTQKLPFPDHYFDAVTMLEVLEHLFDPAEVLSEVRRVLKPGGQLVLSVPNVASLPNRMRLLFGHLPVTSRAPGWDGGHLHYFTRRELDRFLPASGFRITHRKATGRYPRIRELFLSLLTGDFVFACERQP